MRPDGGARRSKGAEIAAVTHGGIAHHLGLAPGDRLLEVNGRPLRDILDYQFLTQEEDLVLRVVRPDGQEVVAEIEKDQDEPLGVTLCEEVFGPVRECDNACVFCFVSQLPPGMREPLYLRDDDLRLSVLDGNFITLTNLVDEDWQRLEEQRLSPLHVSIHTTDDELRRLMLGNPTAPPVLPQLRRLLALGLAVHGQIVLCRGYNDGQALDRSLLDLLTLDPPLASLAIVPVGVTRYGPPSLEPYGSRGAGEVLAQVRRWQSGAGRGVLFAADEWYLLAAEPLPRYGAYGSFPQLANGVGMIRQFEHHLRMATRWLPDALSEPRRAVIVTGRLFAPVLRAMLAERLGRVTGLTWEVVAADNDLFGDTVTVAGLLGGADIVRAARQAVGDADVCIVPAELLRAAGDVTLDGFSPDMIQAELGVDTIFARYVRDMVHAALGRPAGPPPR